MPYSKRFWLSAGAVVLAVIIVVAVIRLRSDEVQRAALFSRPEEGVEATEEFELLELPEGDVISEAEEFEQAVPPEVSAGPMPSPTLTLEEQELLEAAEKAKQAELERRAEEQLRYLQRPQQMARLYEVLATDQIEHFVRTYERLQLLAQRESTPEQRQAFVEQYVQGVKAFEEKRDLVKGLDAREDIGEVDRLIERIKSRMDVLVARLELGERQIPADVAATLEADIELLDKAVSGLDLESE